MIRLFFDLCFYFCREFQKSGPTEENWWIKCTMDPPSFGMESKVGAAMVGSALICKKKIRFNLLKISSNLRAMRWWGVISTLQQILLTCQDGWLRFKSSKEENKIAKKRKIPPRWGRPRQESQGFYTQVGSTCIQELHIKSEISDLNWFLTQVGPKRGSCMR